MEQLLRTNWIYARSSSCYIFILTQKENTKRKQNSVYVFKITYMPITFSYLVTFACFKGLFLGSSSLYVFPFGGFPCRQKTKFALAFLFLCVCCCGWSSFVHPHFETAVVSLCFLNCHTFFMYFFQPTQRTLHKHVSWGFVGCPLSQARRVNK